MAAQAPTKACTWALDSDQSTKSGRTPTINPLAEYLNERYQRGGILSITFLDSIN